MNTLLALIVEMGDDEQDILKAYWSILEQFYTPLYINIIKHD
jgi:hypothetical protein